MGFSGKNSYILGLMTLAFIVGEIAHFLIGEHLHILWIIVTLQGSLSLKTLGFISNPIGLACCKSADVMNLKPGEEI